MSREHNPQYDQMSHESMIRNLAAQIEAIWPQEAPLFERYGLAPDSRIIDVGCGTGEASVRLAAMMPEADITGIDLIESHLEHARTRARPFGDRVRFETGNALALGGPDGRFDLAVCRHVLQAVPDPARALRELMRVTRPGGRLHLIAEDYGMIFMHPTRLGAERFWAQVTGAFGPALGTDLQVGRHLPAMLLEAGALDIALDYVVVDTLRVPRETFAAIFEAWRDGYAEGIAQYAPFSFEEAVNHFDDMIDCIRNPAGYAVWLVPVLSAVVPAPG
jgi:ubiquinone/menaquinone biosynthesis C-methylase UbiE